MKLDTHQLRVELVKRNWKQSDLAEKAGVSRSLIGMICKGMQPSAATFEKIIDVLGPESRERLLSEGSE